MSNDRAPLSEPETASPGAAPPRRGLRAVLLLALVALCAGGAWWWWAQKGEPSSAPAGSPAAQKGGPAGPGGPGRRTVPAVIDTVKAGDVPVVLRAVGTVTARTTTVVRARVDGLLERIAFREGDVVAEGDTLALIDSRPFAVQVQAAQGQLAKDRAQLDIACVDLARYRKLIDQDGIPRQQLDAQEALVRQLAGVVEADAAQLATARLNLSFTKVVAPVSGRVGLRQVDPGNMVRGTDATGIVLITEVQPITVVFSIPQERLPEVLAKAGAAAGRAPATPAGAVQGRAAVQGRGAAPGAAGARGTPDGQGDAAVRERAEDRSRTAADAAGVDPQRSHAAAIARACAGTTATTRATPDAADAPRAEATGGAPAAASRGGSTAVASRGGATAAASRGGSPAAGPGAAQRAGAAGAARSAAAAPRAGGRGPQGDASGAIVVQAIDRDGQTVLDTGRLLAVDNQIDAATGTVKLKAIFRNEEGRLFPNQFVNVRMVIDRLEGALTVPSSAIQRGAAGTFVFAVTEQKTAAVRKVQLGPPAPGERVVVTGGLSEGEPVVVDGADKLRDGAPVTAIEIPAAGARGGRGGARGAQPEGPKGGPADGAKGGPPDAGRSGPAGAPAAGAADATKGPQPARQ